MDASPAGEPVTCKLLLAAPWTVAFVAGCWSEPTQVGSGKPFVLRTAKGWPSVQFVVGELPGTAPPKEAPAPAATGDAGAPKPYKGPPKVIDFSGLPRAIIPGQGDLGITGNISPNAVSVGIQMDGVDDGYWIVPAGAPNDAVHVGSDRALAYQAQADFSDDIPVGKKTMRVVAFDVDGNAGEQLVKDGVFCIQSPFPDPGLTACGIQKLHPNNLKSFPPQAVISLTWDTPVDLDLQVETPSRQIVDPKHPTVNPPNDAGVVTGAHFDRDSNAGCSLEQTRTENLVWAFGDQPHGLYNIYVNEFDACKQQSVRFTVTVYGLVGKYDDGGGLHLDAWGTWHGELLDFQANGGSARGLYVGAFKFK
jgi:hypothetical protein